MAKVKREKGQVDLKRLQEIVDEMDKKRLQVGFFESARYDEGTPVAGVAAVQEFGSTKRGIRPRPFMRPTIERSKDAWLKTIQAGAKRAVNGEGTMADVLERLGLRVAGEIRKEIAQVTQPPLSPITLALRKLKLSGREITGTLVGEVAAAIAEGKTGPGELGDSSGINPKPLVFDAIMLNSVTHLVDDK